MQTIPIDNPENELASRKRGRRAAFSRDAVVRAGLEVAAGLDGGNLSLTSVARSLKVTPMAIYTYFASKDELLQAMSAALLESFTIEIPKRSGPIEKVEIWAYAMRAHFQKHPPLIGMLSWDSHASVAWMNQSKVLFEALRELGLDGQQVAETTLWAWNAIMGAILAELMHKQTPPRMTDAEFAELDPAIRANVQLIRDFVKASDYYDRFFTFHIGRLKDAIAQLDRRPPGVAPER